MLKEHNNGLGVALEKKNSQCVRICGITPTLYQLVITHLSVIKPYTKSI